VFDHLLRALKDRLLAPVARVLGPSFSPNALSWMAFAIGLGSAWAIWRGQLGWALALWLANRTVDGLDGTQARVHGRESQFGAYLDIVLDFGVYAAIPIAIVAAQPTAPYAVAGMVLLGSFFVNAASWMYLAAILEQRNEGAKARGELTSITMPRGLVAGTETVVFYSLFLMWPSLQVPLFWIMAGLVFTNVVVRLLWARRRLHA
jgi:phosphatidylglycerophosphate synthase